MSGADTATRADAWWTRITTNTSVTWWRVLDAEILAPPMNAAGAVWTLYDREVTR